MKSKREKKVSKVMREFKKGKLNIGGSKKKVKSRKQAIAIALNEAGIKRKKKCIFQCVTGYGSWVLWLVLLPRTV